MQMMEHFSGTKKTLLKKNTSPKCKSLN